MATSMERHKPPRPTDVGLHRSLAPVPQLQRGLHADEEAVGLLLLEIGDRHGRAARPSCPSARRVPEVLAMIGALEEVRIPT
jgi:hypothetical protein